MDCDVGCGWKSDGRSSDCWQTPDTRLVSPVFHLTWLRRPPTCGMVAGARFLQEAEERRRIMMILKKLLGEHLWFVTLFCFCWSFVLLRTIDRQRRRKRRVMRQFLTRHLK